jgi:hypothetical protein
LLKSVLYYRDCKHIWWQVSQPAIPSYTPGPDDEGAMHP